MELVAVNSLTISSSECLALCEESSKQARVRGTHSVDSLLDVLASSRDGMGVTLLPESVDFSRGVRASGVEGPSCILGGVEGLQG